MPDFETLGYEERDGVAWVTMDRPDVLNAFNLQMQHDLVLALLSSKCKPGIDGNRR